MLQKQPVSIPFAQGLDTKTDPYQVQAGKFLSLQNTVFNKGGLLTKRNGYGQLASLSSNNFSYLTTLNENLTAIGPSISAYSLGSSTWVDKGTIAPMAITTLALIRNNINQTQADAVVAANGLVCTVYTETDGTNTFYKYAIADSVTGQNIISPSPIPVMSGTVTGSPRVFFLGHYFIIAFTNVIAATSHLQYVAIDSINPTIVTSNVDIATYTSSTRLSWDAVVVGNSLFFAWNTLVGGQSIMMIILTNTLALTGTTTFVGSKATIMSVTADVSIPATPIIYATFYDSVSTNGYSLAVDKNLNTILAPTQVITAKIVLNLATAAQNGLLTLYSEINNNYSYDAAIPTHYIESTTMTQAGIVASPFISIRSVGLASKAFIINGVEYYLSTYQSPYQPTYFLINGSTSTFSSPQVVAKLAYQNGGGYLNLGLPGVTVTGTLAQVAYLFKDVIQAVNKNTNVPAGTQVNGIYSQTGINLASFNIENKDIDTKEIANNLHISGGFLWMYDGYLPVEHNFFLYPDSIEAAWSAAGGSIVAKPDGATNTNAYFYQVTYEWTDNQGNAFRSAPSIPISVTTTGAGSTGSITINVPTLRLTYKTANPVKIVIYRWSVAQQIYYQVTSIFQPILNSTSTDSITYVDTLSDAVILGNNIIYTTGGVVEDTNAPATNIMTLFDTRLWLVDAEDKNLLWFSKQVIEATPVEMSDLFTKFIAPSTGVQQSTGPITALSVMDDKLIIFKREAIYYVNGSGPDNTGANNQYSEPIPIASTVGCTNQHSVVFMPQGLMFQSDKGIWLLGRDLSTSYIGAAVEQFNSSIVQAVVNVPQTNQVRFTLNTGQTLMYDYYYGQWGEFTGIPATAACIYQGLHTFINSFGQVYQESPGLFLDGSNPVLMSFVTSWFNLAGLQGYQRAYFFYILGTYYSPHKLDMQIAYDYNSSPSQSTLISPTNYGVPYGVSSPYGQQHIYGSNNIEQWRVFLQRQRCQAFQITLNEVYDATIGQPPGQGLSISGLNLVVAIKKGWKPIAAVHSAG